VYIQFVQWKLTLATYDYHNIHKRTDFVYGTQYVIANPFCQSLKYISGKLAMLTGRQLIICSEFAYRTGESSKLYAQICIIVRGFINAEKNPPLKKAGFLFFFG